MHYIHNVQADTTEIAVPFHCCDRSGIVAFVGFCGNEVNKPLHSNGHLPNITHVGGSLITPSLRWLGCSDVEECGEADVAAATRSSGSWRRRWCGRWCYGWSCYDRKVADGVPEVGLVEYVGWLGPVGWHGDVGTSHTSDIWQMLVAMQRLVDFISIATHKRNNTGVTTTVKRKCDFCCVRLGGSEELGQ
jgi:hypothetical protein